MAYLKLNAHSQDLGLVTVTFKAEGKPFTFIIDTGSNVSHIDEEAFKLFNDQDQFLTDDYMITGISGNLKSSCKTKKILNAGIFTFEHEYFVTDLSSLLTWLRSEGLDNVHGILGTDFLIKYRCHLDFKKNRLHLG